MVAESMSNNSIPRQGPKGQRATGAAGRSVRKPRKSRHKLTPKKLAALTPCVLQEWDIAYGMPVLRGELVVGRYVFLAVQRHYQDLVDGPGRGLYFSPEHGRHVIDYIQRFFVHIKGPLAGKPIMLDPWQRFWTAVLYGWRRASDGCRRFSRAYEEVARKNGKSTWKGPQGAYLFSMDGEAGAEVYAVATTRNQAMTVFKPAFDNIRRWAKRSAGVARSFKIYAGLKDAVDAAFKAELERLDGILSANQQQIDAVKGVDTSVLSLAQAVTGLQSSLIAAQQNSMIAANSAINAAYQSALGRVPDSGGLAYYQNAAQSGTPTSQIVDSIKNSSEAQIVGLYRSLLGRAPDAGGLSFWVQAAKNGVSISQITKDFIAGDEYKKLHPFAIGTNYVPTDMPALIHKGERIIPAADNRELMARLNSPLSQPGDQALDLQAIRDLLLQILISNSRTADGAARTADIIERVSAGGGPLLVRMEGV